MDRRLITLAAALVLTVVIVVVVHRGPDTGRAPVPAAESMVGAQAGRTMAESTTSTSMAAAIVTTDAQFTPATTVTSSLAADAPIEELVAANRPDAAAMETMVVVDDGHQDQPAMADPADVAASVAVSLWSWRYDDEPQRLSNELAGFATGELLEAAVPSVTELQRRVAEVEVSWAVATAVTATADIAVSTDSATITVEVDQHLLTVSAAEAVTRRRVVVALGNGRNGWQATAVASELQ